MIQLKVNISFFIIFIMMLSIGFSSCKLQTANKSNLEDKFKVIYYNYLNRDFIVKIPIFKPEIESNFIEEYQSFGYDRCKINNIIIEPRKVDLLLYENGCIYPEMNNFPIFSRNSKKSKIIMYDYITNNFEIKTIVAYTELYKDRCNNFESDLNRNFSIVSVNMIIKVSEYLFYVKGIFDLRNNNKKEIFEYVENLKKIEIIEVTN
ncbi:MAG: hypothetical protein IPH57_08045 [Saprospiraceae bacterium]|nr:hypothetical protein [Saprospiraceae bacterium]